jgi:aryl-phospho-beta-D-glucosidase BglC (GH1 family)
MTRYMGSSTCSELDLWKKGYSETPGNFKTHWDTFVDKDDIFNLVYNYGINTFRIPIGYWIVEELTYYSGGGREPFPLGGYPYLVRMLGWIKEAGAYAILDLHGAPGGQVNNAFTGQCNTSPDFYTTYNYGRAVKWARNMTRLAHTQGDGAVFAIQAVNEPERDGAKTPGLQQFYTDFANAIRDEESKMGIYCKTPTTPSTTRVVPSNYDNCVNIMYQDKTWQYNMAANPANSCKGLCLYDDHNYACFGGPSSESEYGYLNWFCDDNRIYNNYQLGQSAIITGEWSLCNKFGASSYTKQKLGKAQTYKYTYGSGAKGYIFWSFKTEQNDPNWSYTVAVDQGLLPKIPGKGSSTVCY